MNELRLTLRRLVKRPGATTASVLTLACAIGAAAATWSLLSAVLLRPLHVPHAERLMVVGAHGAQDPATQTAFTYPIFQSIRSSDVFSSVAAGGAWSAYVVARGEGQSRRAFFASANFFTVLGLPVQLGRDFVEDDDRRGAMPVAILSDRFWRTSLGADPSVIGQTILVENNRVHNKVQIVGVAASGFQGVNIAEPADIFGTLNAVDQAMGRAANFFADTDRGMSPTAWITIVGQLRAGQTSEMAAAQLAGGVAGLHGRAVTLIPIQTAALPEASRPAMAQFTRLLSITVGLLLLIGCVTVGMLLLIRTEARRGEFAMCLALGASRGRLMRGVATEGALLSAGGAVLSLPATAWFFAALRTLELPGGVRIDMLPLGIDRPVLIATAAVAIAAMLVITALAGVLGMSVRIADAIRARAGSTPRLARRRTRAVLVICQVAITLVLVSGAGLFSRSLAAALHVNPGFDTTGLVTGHVSLGQFRFQPEPATPFFNDLLERLNANPAIRSASLTSTLVGMSTAGEVVINGVGRRLPSIVWMTAIDERYLQTIGLPLLKGRNFTREDDARAPLVTIVSASLAGLVSDTRDVLQTNIQSFRGRGDGFPQVAIVGVVPDVITDVARLHPLVMYVPVPQEGPGWQRDIVLRPSGSVEAAIRETLATIRTLDPHLDPPPTTTPIVTVDEQITGQMGPQRFGRLVLGTLGGIALLLTVLGVYVLAESMAAARTREMGIRAALGARGGDLSAMVLRETTRLIGVGLVVGLGLAWIEAATIRAFLFRVQPLDPVTLASVAAIILTLALAVSLRPALAAARVDLSRVLREE